MKRLVLLFVVIMMVHPNFILGDNWEMGLRIYNGSGLPMQYYVELYKYNGFYLEFYRSGYSDSTLLSGNVNGDCDIYDSDTRNPIWAPIVGNQTYYLKVDNKYVSFHIDSSSTMPDFIIRYQSGVFHFDQLSSIITVSDSTTYTWNEVNASFKQYKSDGVTSMGTIAIGKGSTFSSRYNAPFNFYIDPNQDYLFHADTTIISSQKYYNWQDISDVTNFRVKNSSTSDFEIRSNFNPTYSGVTIQNNILDIGSNSYNIGFMDPWLIDYADPNHGNNRRNEGMSASYVLRSSPFYPDYSTNYNGNSYKGVFLNKPYGGTTSYYSVSFPSNQYVTINGVNHNLYFQNWTVNSSANVQNSLANPTPVVFTDTTAVVTANVKIGLATNNFSATGYGSQRKITEDYNGTLHMVYASANKIWYTKSTDGGSTWSADQQISGSGTASTPCIASSDGALGYDVYFVWQETAGSTNYLYIKSLSNIPTAIALDSVASTVDLQPAVAVSSDEDKVLVMYKKMYSGRYQIHYKYSSDYGSTFSVGGPLSISTPIIWNLPSVAWDPQSSKFMISTIYSSGYLTTDLLSYNGTTWTNEGNVYYSTQVPNAAPYSQVAVDGTGRTHVTWIAYDNYYSENSASMERSMLNGSWSTTSIFRDEVLYDPSIVYTSVCGHNGSGGGASIFYTSSSNQTLFDIYSTDNSSWNGLIYISPSAPISYPVALEKASPQSVSYTAVKGSSSPYEVKNQTKDNSSAGTSTGSFKIAANNSSAGTNLRSVKLYRRIELIDTTNNGMLVAQFGNIKGNAVTFLTQDTSSINNIRPSFMSTTPFSFAKNDSLAVEFGVRSKGWKDNANLIFELIEPSSGNVIKKIGEYDYTSSDTVSIYDNKISEIVNGLQNTNAALRVRLAGVDYKNLVVTNANVMVFSSGNASSPILPKSFVQLGEVPNEYQLNQNYPNPFNPTTAISYQLSAYSHVTLKVYDVLGRLVKTLVDGYKSQGRYSINFDANNLASGIYFYQLRVVDPSLGSGHDFISTKKLMLIK